MAEGPPQFTRPAGESPSHPPWVPQPSTSPKSHQPHVKREVSRAGWRTSHGEPAPTPSSTISSLLPTEHSRTHQLPPIRCHQTTRHLQGPQAWLCWFERRVITEHICWERVSSKYRKNHPLSPIYGNYFYFQWDIFAFFFNHTEDTKDLHW